ncbi:hypothetical protein VNO80_30299 [Phaseolus coccineus]|uniref:DUF4220 domain-containing protein n=1 Tax=Phaseolus coccineus TaxID=3886 RepID=A0AAN9LCZ6_PHACN
MVNPIPYFARNIWGKWNIQGAVLVSLSMQIILIFAAPFRKRSRNTLLVSLLWFTYLVADVTANFCVGLISNKYGDKDTAVSTIDDYLIAFWTPFLLLHLGGPDTITAFSIEDNELWRRHMLGLIVQVCLTSYVFLLTLPENTLWIPTALVFMAGVIKFAERTRSLQLASLSNFRQSMVNNPDSGPNYAKLVEELKSTQEAGLPAVIVNMPEISDEFTDIEPEPSGAKPDNQPPNTDSMNEIDGQSDSIYILKESQTKATSNSAKSQPHIPKSDEMADLSDLDVMKGAYDHFNTFKGLVVDMIFNFQERRDSRNYLLGQTAVDALRVIEVELNFIYQSFYTKTTIIESWLGLSFRFVSISSVVAALVVFIYEEKRGCEPFDVKVTYILLYGAVALEVLSIVMFFFSDYSFALIYSRNSQKIRDSYCGTRTGMVTSKVVTIFSRVLMFKRPKWTEHKVNKPEWFKNKSYKVLERFVLLRRWSETISGFNLISYCLHKKKSWLDWVIDKIGAEEFVEQWMYEKNMPMLQRLWIFIFTELKRKSGDADDVETIQRICSSRGEWVIQEGDLSREDQNKLMRYVERNEVTFDECLILWHIATDLLFYANEKQNENDDEQKQKTKNAQDLEQGNHDDEDGDIQLRHFSKLLSDYMLYLLIRQPTMMSVVSVTVQKRFHDTCKVATNFFRKRKMNEQRDRKNKRRPTSNSFRSLAKDMCEKLREFIQFMKKGTRCFGIFFKEKEEADDSQSKLQEACKELIKEDVDYELYAVEGDRSKSLLFDACKLATVINGVEGTNKWKLIAQVWVELLSYAATNCTPISHVQQLGKGGEFLSLVWLLMTHLGLAKQFQIKDHSRAKLVVIEDYESRRLRSRYTLRSAFIPTNRHHHRSREPSLAKLKRLPLLHMPRALKEGEIFTASEDRASPP